MTFLEKLTMLMAEKKVNRKTLSTELQIGKNQIKYWEDKGTLPDGSTLIKIARYFDVSVDYLLGEQNQQKTAADTLPLSPEQQKILDYCSDLSDADLGKVLEYIELLHMRRKNSENSDA